MSARRAAIADHAARGDELPCGARRRRRSSVSARQAGVLQCAGAREPVGQAAIEERPRSWPLPVAQHDPRRPQRPGNAAANDIADHLEVLDAAVSMLPEPDAAGHREGDDSDLAERPLVVRIDAAGCSATLAQGLGEPRPGWRTPS
ncbi:hypothetical protein [Candidatus Poriferisodalis sp.]|uniref:hypothetical protein n=1 Tax=Candidatus Poriferisodalis sp. TaxID=3101277 RepID=UPI003B025634